MEVLIDLYTQSYIKDIDLFVFNIQSNLFLINYLKFLIYYNYFFKINFI